MDSDTLAADSAVATAGSINSADGTALAYRAWPVEGASKTFAVIHGLGEHSGRYEHFAQGMAKFHIGTYAIDLRGHGNSAGRRGHVDSWSQWTDDAAAFVKHLETAGAGEVIPLGHSFGGVVLLSAMLAGRIPNAKRFVLSSPALKLRAKVPAWKTSLAGMISNVAPKLAMSNEVDPGTISRIPEIVEAYRNDPLVHSKISSRLYTEWQRAAAEDLARASEIKVPFLILAGTDDRLIDPAGSRQLNERAKTMSELKMLDGRFHEPFNDRDSDEVFAMIAEWLRK